MLTGNESDHQRDYAMFLGVDEYMSKPVQPAQLLRSIDYFLSLMPPNSSIAP
jgi:DNA-binding response OmpR family regulator